jgi:hypothetical protein
MDRKLTSHPGGYEPVSLADVEVPSVSAEPSPTVVVSSPTSPHSEKTSIQFAKAAFLFKDKLDDVRKNKRTTAVHEEEVLPTPLSPPAPLPPSSSPPEDPPEGEDSSDPIAARRLRILRLVQSTLTSFLSIAIAVLQGKAYLAYQRTKDTPGAWPTHPNLMPTTLLLVVGILAGAFDLSLLLAYLLPSRAKTLLGVATKSHNLLTCVKGVSYLLVSVVCRSGFDYGNASGQNNDLWGWTCSSAADQFADVTQAGANCDGQVGDPRLAPSPSQVVRVTHHSSSV